MIDIKHLPNCRNDETLIYFLRRHPISLVGVFVGYILLLLMPIAAFTILQVNWPELVTDPVFFPLVVLGSSLFFLFCWLFLFQAFLDYYLDIWIVTNHRIVNMTQTGLFHREVAELRLYRVQDASASVRGFLATILGYGRIEIQTAGEHAHFVFEDIPHPQEVAKTILQLAEKDRSESIGDVVEELELESNKHHDSKKPSK